MNDYILRSDALAVARYSHNPVEGLEQLPGIGWRPVSEPPEEEGIYLVRATDGNVYVESYGDIFGNGEQIWTRKNIVKWMEVPNENPN